MPVQLKNSLERKYEDLIAKFNNFEGCVECPECPDEELDSTKYKIAFCGRCKYNAEIKRFANENYYPYCGCVIGRRIILERCLPFESDESGVPLGQNVSFDYGTVNTCPLRHKIYFENKYDLMIFRPYQNMSELKRLDEKMKHVNFLLRFYKNEIIRLRNLHPSFLGKLISMVTFDMTKRQILIKHMEILILSLDFTFLDFSFKHLGLKVKESGLKINHDIEELNKRGIDVKSGVGVVEDEQRRISGNWVNDGRSNEERNAELARRINERLASLPQMQHDLLQPLAIFELV